LFDLSSADMQSLTELAQDLVRTPSVSGRENAIAALLADAMRRAGFHEVWLDRMGNVIGRYGSGNGPKLLFDGHLDTTDVGNRSAWPRDPFGGEIENGILYGRGASDMKGGLAALVYGVKLLADSHTQLNGDLYVACVVQQEPCEGMAIRTLIEEGGLQPNYVVLAEPTNLGIYLGHRGRVELQLTTYGRAYHSADPDKGVNAISGAARLVFGIELLASQLLSDPSLGQGSLAVTQISSAGNGVNTIPDRCCLLVDRRLTLGETEARAVTEIQQVIRREGVNADIDTAAYETTSYTGYICRGRKYFPPWLTVEKEPLVRAVARVAERVLGYHPRLGTWSFSTDGTYTMGLAGIPTVGFGPGDERYAHTAEEQIRLADVAEASRVYAQLAVELLV
jgi:putative selenium metabolism hydrolase